MDFYYELINTSGMTEEQVEQVEHALAHQAYVCQQEFEKMLDLYHEINVLMDAEDEAFISSILIEDGEVFVTLDCSRVVMSD
jgi:hypothetical protein